MRLRWGRPDLLDHLARFGVPLARPGAPLSVTFLGVSTLLLDDGEAALLTDGFFSRPPLRQVVAGRIAPDRVRVQACLTRAGVRRLAGVIPVHTHYDHALDSALVADLTGATLLGGASAANVGRGYGLPEERIRVAAPGETVDVGSFAVSFVASEHCPPDRYPGSIDEPVRPPTRVGSYRCGRAWSLVVRHRPSARSVLIQGSAGYRRDALSGHQAEVAYLGVGQLGVQPVDYLREYWAETVRAVGARRVVLTHWDDFFRPLDEPLRALPYAGDDLGASVRELSALASADGIDVQLPTVWAHADPWEALDRIASVRTS